MNSSHERTLLAVLLAACTTESMPAGDLPVAPSEPKPILSGPTKGSALAVSPNGETLAVANKSSGDLTLFALPALTERARVVVGEEPQSVCWHPDGRTLFVVVRKAGTLVPVEGADGASPVAKTAIPVGAEAAHCAMLPAGDLVAVTSWADGTVSLVDTASRRVLRTLELGGAPYAACATNDGDDRSDDETLFVTDFYSRPIAGVKEVDDEGRQGRVFAISTADFAVREHFLAPRPAEIAAAPGTSAFANQLYACAVNKERLYVTSVSASPESFNGGTDFRQNLQGFVYVLGLDGTLDAGRTVNLNTLVEAQAAPKRFVSAPVDIAFAVNTEIAYVVSILSNSLFRVDYGKPSPTGGAPNANFLETSLSPTGVAIGGTKAFVYNEVARTISVIDLANQATVTKDLASAPAPSSDADKKIQKGQRFFNTGLARWSQGAWVGCVGCHPFGTTDNVTWSFPAGPRQTVDTSATFDKSGRVHRILNWTAIFDEISDFELNTRTVANGTGAIVSTAELNADGSPNGAARIDFVGPGGVANPTNAFNVGSSNEVARGGATPEEWDDIELYLKTVRAPKGRTRGPGDAARGREVFVAGNCQYCHGGALWTLSERYYAPRKDFDPRNKTLASQAVTSIGVRSDLLKSIDPAAVAVVENDANGAPARHSCVVRKVGTFEARGPDARGGDEVRQNGAPAQGVDGFNVPSLLGVNLGAPYLHNGAAESLEALLDPNGQFVDHLRSGNLVFAPTASEVSDLIAFLRSIDDETPVIEVPSAQRFCPTDVR